MKDPENNKKLSRRRFLPLLSSTFLLPVFGLGNTDPENIPADDSEYETLLKPDGTTVKVPKSAVRNSKVVKKHMSNRSLLKWLNKNKD